MLGHIGVKLGRPKPPLELKVVRGIRKTFYRFENHPVMHQETWMGRIKGELGELQAASPPFLGK